MTRSRRIASPTRVRTRKYFIMGALLLLCGVLAARQPGVDPAPGETVGDGVLVAPAPSSLSVFDLLVKGGPLMIPLCLCSILMVAFVIERALSLRRGRILPPEILRHLDPGDLAARGGAWPAALLRVFSGQNSPIARILTAGLRKAGKPAAEIEKAVEDAGEKVAAGMRRKCKPLAVVANISPLLGLLGTVMGMISAFMTVAAREEALGRTELLAAGIYQALVTTAVGLTIAIPSLVFYYFFVERVDRLVSEIDEIATELVERLSAS